MVVQTTRLGKRVGRKMSEMGPYPFITGLFDYLLR
jgi:hypothetical protein